MPTCEAVHLKSPMQTRNTIANCICPCRWKNCHIFMLQMSLLVKLFNCQFHLSCEFSIVSRSSNFCLFVCLFFGGLWRHGSLNLSLGGGGETLVDQKLLDSNSRGMSTLCFFNMFSTIKRRLPSISCRPALFVIRFLSCGRRYPLILEKKSLEEWASSGCEYELDSDLF